MQDENKILKSEVQNLTNCFTKMFHMVELLTEENTFLRDNLEKKTM